jgi:hypothetical protein
LEREYLSGKEFDLAPTQRELAYRGEYYLYLALTKPDSLLYLSYCRMNSECEPMRPSYLLHKIQMLYQEPLEGWNEKQQAAKGFYEKRENVGNEEDFQDLEQERSDFKPEQEKNEQQEQSGFKTEQGKNEQQGQSGFKTEQEKKEEQEEIKEGRISLDNRKKIEQIVRLALGADEGFRYFVEGLRSYENWEKQPLLWKGLFYYYAKKKPEKLEQLLFCAFGKNGTMKISEKTAKLLYGSELSGGVTRFEKFAACAYAHFLAYGLELKERQEFVLHSVDIGNIFHEALRIFGEKASAQENGWHGFAEEKEEERIKMSEESLMEALNNGKVPGAHALLSSSFRNQHLIQRMKRMMEKTTEILTYQLQEGQMEPAGYEINFSKMNLAGMKLKLSDTERMKLRGQIDRLDRSQEEPYCIRVVDYKTGKKEFSLTDVYYGLQMQLVVYLKAGMESSGVEEAEMAGGYYYRIDDPFAKEKNPAENEWKKLLKLQGISNSDPEIVQQQDKKLASDGAFHASVRSDVISFATSSKGEIDKRSSIAAEKKDLSSLMDYVQETLIQMGTEILDGKIERNPYQKSAADTACMYCDFGDMCNPKDPSQPGAFRKLSKDIPKEISAWKNKNGNVQKSGYENAQKSSHENEQRSGSGNEQKNRNENKQKNRRENEQKNGQKGSYENGKQLNYGKNSNQEEE